MKKVLSRINKLNHWWDNIKEPNRFLYFMLFVGVPIAFLMSYNPLIGAPVILILVSIRILGHLI